MNCACLCLLVLTHSIIVMAQLITAGILLIFFLLAMGGVSL